LWHIVEFFILFKRFHVNCFYFLQNTDDGWVILGAKLNDMSSWVCFVWMWTDLGWIVEDWLLAINDRRRVNCWCFGRSCDWAWRWEYFGHQQRQIKWCLSEERGHHFIS
jgi:hypothetical protein